ncbi:MAG: extradiol ring-cleavage dioxygenase [Actinomycetia bacterium]|nr:extradiol ring-cleavage dioxygenase [Actinomycetes bacterium]
MAGIVLGVGTSHSPLLTLEAGDWAAWAERDHTSRLLFDEHGINVTYDERLAQAGDAFRPLVGLEQFVEARARSCVALDLLAARIADAALDALVIVGDDQDEYLREDNLPALVVYWGDTIYNGSAHAPHERTPLAQRGMLGYLEDGPGREYPVASALAGHLIDVMLARDIDVASARTLRDPGRTMGHAFGFPMRRLVPSEVPIVPVMVNTYNPPTRPRAQRCVDYGRAIRAAIDSFGGRVGVMASGGLSHFLLLEDLDRRVIDALARGDLDDLARIPEPVYRAGTSEIKTWITVAAACHDLSFDLVDYIPVCRTLAGSGIGLGFATWC